MLTAEAYNNLVSRLAVETAGGTLGQEGKLRVLTHVCHRAIYVGKRVNTKQIQLGNKHSKILYN